MRFYALIRKEKTSDFGVEFPDFPGCITAGKDLDEAAHLAEEALNFHIDGLLEDGEPIPKPSPLDAIDTKGAVPFLVPAHERKKSRINVTISEWVIAQVDNTATVRGMSRSAFLEEAAKQKLATAD